MSSVIDLIIDSFPADGATGIPLLAAPTITLSGIDFDTDSIEEGVFLEGPDTDQFVGPGVAELRYPNGISQGEIDDLLESPGYTGMVSGTVTVSGVSGNTLITFTPTNILAALTEYTLYVSNLYEADGETEIDGVATLSFTTGSGSIEAVPSNISTSVLVPGSVVTGILATAEPLRVLSTTPTDHSVEQRTSLSEIVVVFNKDLDSSTITSDVVEIETEKATDHPNVTITSPGTLAKILEVDGATLTIKI